MTVDLLHKERKNTLLFYEYIQLVVVQNRHKKSYKMTTS